MPTRFFIYRLAGLLLTGCWGLLRPAQAQEIGRIRFEQLSLDETATQQLVPTTEPLLPWLRVRVDSIRIDGRLLVPDPVLVDPKAFNPTTVAAMLLTNLQAEAQRRGVSRHKQWAITKNRPLYSQLLFPRRHFWWPRRWHDTKRENAHPGWAQEQRISQQYERQLAARLLEGWNNTRLLNPGMGMAPALGANRRTATTRHTGPRGGAVVDPSPPGPYTVLLGAVTEPNTVRATLTGQLLDGNYRFRLTRPAGGGGATPLDVQTLAYAPDDLPLSSALAGALIYQARKGNFDFDAPTNGGKAGDTTQVAIARANLRLALETFISQVRPQPVQTAGIGPARLFAGQGLLPPSDAAHPVRRPLQVYIQDRGDNGLAGFQLRYLVCLQYETAAPAPAAGAGATPEPATAGAQGVTDEKANSNAKPSGSVADAATGGCTLDPGHAGVSVQLASLEERTIFVETLVNALRAKDTQFQNKIAVLAQTATTEQAAADAIKATMVAALPDAAEATKIKQAETKAQAAQAEVNQLAAQKLNLTKLEPDGTFKGNKSTVDLSLEGVLGDIFDDFVRQKDRLALLPKTGYVLLGSAVEVYHRPDSTQDIEAELFQVDSVQLEVEDGNATGIKAFGNFQGEQVLFESFAPIGISSDNDLTKAWYQQWLWIQSSWQQGGDNKHCIRLADLLRYYPLLIGRTSDRSPADGVYVFRPTDTYAKRLLTKIPIVRLLQARIYSDLAGIENDHPNGLIQAEIGKKFILRNTYSKARNVQLSMGNYIYPLVALNKIEEKDRYLPLARLDPAPEAIKSRERRLPTIDLLRYTALRVGFDQNILVMRTPRIKSDFALDLACFLHRVPFRDTIFHSLDRKTDRRAYDSIVNVFVPGVNLRWRIRPDPRYGLLVRVGYLRPTLLNSRSQNSTLFFQKPDSAPWRRSWWQRLHNEYTVIQYELTGWVETSPNAQFFVRTQLSHGAFQVQRTYFQMQLGYQFDVFSSRRTAALPAGLFTK